MLLLDSTSDIVKVITVGATVALDVHADWVDKDGSTITPGSANHAQIVVAATDTIVAAPTGTAIRNVKGLRLTNRNVSASISVQLQHYDGTTSSNIYPTFALLAGYCLTYDEGMWQLIDSSGAPVVTALAGRFLGRTTILNGTTTFTTGPATNSIVARMVAGGGQGGGAATTTGFNGSGGGAGSYAEWKVAVSPNTAYTVAVGAGGTTGTTGANGQTGGNTTFAVGATTVTCNGGVGGIVGASASVPVIGSAGGAISTNGTLNAGGAAGSQSICTGTAANNSSGKGGDSEFGAGGGDQVNASNATGLAAVGFGGGGGGGTSTGTAHAGGAGSNGIIVVDEYS